MQSSISQALEKFAVAAKNIEEDGIKKVLELFYQLDLQYLNNEAILKALYGDIFPKADDGTSLASPALIRAQVNFQMTVLSEMVGKDRKVNSILGYYNGFKDMLAPDSKEIIAKQVWDLLGFDDDQIHMAPPLPPMPMPGAPGLPGATPPPPGGGAPGPRGGLPVGVPSNSVPMNPKQTAAAGAAILKQSMNGQVNQPGVPSTPVGDAG
jgi:hypothetical protein